MSGYNSWYAISLIKYYLVKPQNVRKCTKKDLIRTSERTLKKVGKIWLLDNLSLVKHWSFFPNFLSILILKFIQDSSQLKKHIIYSCIFNIIMFTVQQAYKWLQIFNNKSINFKIKWQEMLLHLNIYLLSRMIRNTIY